MMHRWRRKQYKAMHVVGMLLMLVMVVMVPITGHAAESKLYQVIFRAGSQGSFPAGEQSLTAKVPYMSVINTADYDYLVSPKDGYYFTGWSPTEGELTISKKTTLVAQYARIINEAVYQVKYVDIYGNQLATPKVVTTQEGASVTEAAVEMEGYAVDAATKQLEQKNEITFTYTPLNVPGREVITETVVLPGGTTITTVVLPQTTAAGAGGAAQTAAGVAGGAEAVTPPAEQVVAPDEATPLENQDLRDDVVTVPDETTPKAATILGRAYMPWIIGIVLIVVVAAGIFLGVRKIKKMKK